VGKVTVAAGPLLGFIAQAFQYTADCGIVIPGITGCFLVDSYIGRFS
jgi:hypothetical protein